MARCRVGDAWEETAVDAVQAGDVLLVRAGEVEPADGALLSEHAAIDASTVTGESLPVDAAQGETVRSGTVNAGAPFELLATRGARDQLLRGLGQLVALIMGWVNADKYNIRKIMPLYTAAFIGSIIFGAMAGVTAPRDAIIINPQGQVIQP